MHTIFNADYYLFKSKLPNNIHYELDGKTIQLDPMKECFPVSLSVQCIQSLWLNLDAIFLTFCSVHTPPLSE